MGFSIGVFRFDRGNYYAYTIGFNDISGLVRKAEVKIAGVKVGWVEDIILQPEAYQKAQAGRVYLLPGGFEPGGRRVSVQPERFCR